MNENPLYHKIKSYFLFLFLITILSTILSGCGGAEPIPAVQPTPDSTATPRILPSSTPTELPTPIPTPEGCTQQQGEIEQHQIKSSILGKTLFFQVYLPPCYSRDSIDGYPLLVLLHGQSMTESIWEEMGIAETADKLIAEKNAPPFVIVMPREEYYLQNLYDSSFDEAVMQELMPNLMEEFNLSSNPEYRAIGGISRGASWALLIGLDNWDTFSAIGAHSVPNAPFSTPRLKYVLESIPQGKIPTIWIDIGKSDSYFQYAQKLNQIMTDFDIEHEWHVSEGAHNAEYWKAHFMQYLTWYAQHWK